MASSHEAGMVRLTLSAGKVHGVRPNDVVGTIAHHANIPGHTIGAIRIQEHHTLVDVPADLVAQVLAAHGLVYPVFPGEYSASLGGNVATNAGGMRAVKYGVTRHHVTGIEAVLPSGEVIRSGGKVSVKH